MGVGGNALDKTSSDVNSSDDTSSDASDILRSLLGDFMVVKSSLYKGYSNIPRGLYLDSLVLNKCDRCLLTVDGFVLVDR